MESLILLLIDSTLRIQIFKEPVFRKERPISVAKLALLPTYMHEESFNAKSKKLKEPSPK